MINYMGQNQHRGIQFTADGNELPGGFVITWFGGPLAFWSKKLSHCGHSAAHNEYMALAAAIKRTVWLRQLIGELSVCHEVLDHPTLVLGDNSQAIRLSNEQFISSGNQYIDIDYHFITKERVQDGTAAVHWIPGVLNLADLCTKAISRQVLGALIGGLTGYDNPSFMDNLLLSIK